MSTTDLMSLDDAALAAVALDELAPRFRTGGSHELAQRLLEVHPALREPSAQFDLLSALHADPSRGETYLTMRLVPRLAAAGFRSAAPLIDRLYSARAEPHLFRALVALEHHPTLERLDQQLEATLRRTLRFEPKWDANHAIAEVRDVVVAAHWVSGDRAAERFARYFIDDAVLTESGAKIAHDILLLGLGIANQHQAQVATGAGDLLDRDPRWLHVCARLAGHPKLDAIAQRVLRRLAVRTRLELVEATEASWPAALPKRKTKKRKPLAPGTLVESMSGARARVASDDGMNLRLESGVMMSSAQWVPVDE